MAAGAVSASLGTVERLRLKKVAPMIRAELTMEATAIPAFTLADGPVVPLFSEIT